MNKPRRYYMKKILFSLCVLFLATFILAGCDEIKQVVSDIAEEEIETQVNDMLGLTEEDELFQLPEAKRYEEFNIFKSNSIVCFNACLQYYI